MRLVVAVPAVLLLAACTSSAKAPSHPSNPSTPSSPSTTSSASGSTALVPSTDWPTYHGDYARTGYAQNMPAAQGDPHVVRKVALDANVYASPIVVGATTFVATESNTVYALDAQGAQLWKQHLGSPSPAGERPCGNIDPLGITGTPVYDAASKAVFVAPEYGGPPRHEVVALDAGTGAVRWRKSLDLPGVDAKAMQERGALTISAGRVWTPFGGLAGDCGAYKGRVIGIALDGTGTPISYTVPTGREAGIWTPPGPSVDAQGRLFVSVGNGESGVGDRYDFSDSVLAVSTTGALLDSFSPATWATDNAADKDLGSQGPAFVGQWIFIAGKSGTAYVLRHDHLGGIGGQVSQASVCSSFGGTAVVQDVVYVPCTDGVRAVRIDTSGHLHVLWHAAETITGSPVVGGGRVWTLDTDNGVLHGLDPATGKSLGSVSVGAVTRFATPALTGSRVLVPTKSGYTIVDTRS